ncbi:MAG: DNA (cytosine-5-)-methyltransferase [Actinobacteria bacterium]|uniref:DNA (cytosine-5-)-methyltransferase n=1 Tax=freshwater metagenome TaxID=449393 RepID=A0A6J7RD30_9ZZZZ|nr:DNA (cytosine-5-)-methyltransferase [Actinomycetota bacterium]
MRPKSGLPKRKSLRREPKWDHAFRDHPRNAALRHPNFGGSAPIAPKSTVVSLFSGAGGFDLGFLGGFRSVGQEREALPFDLIAAYDNDPRAVETYQLNLSDDVSCLDLTTVAANDLPAADVLIGGFPCQDFSSCGPKDGFEGKRGRLYQVMTEYAEAHQPRVIVAENVPHLAKMQGGAMLRDIVADFAATGYRTEVWILPCPDFGLPQSRKRIFIVSVREDIDGMPIPPRPTHAGRHIPIDEAIDDLMAIEDETIPNQSQYFVATKATAGAGQGDQVSQRGKLAYTVRANAKARIHFHYELERRLTVRECARLQAFPDEFVFPFFAMNSMLQIGNAVPPIIGHSIGRAISTFLHDGQTREAHDFMSPLIHPEFSDDHLGLLFAATLYELQREVA